MKIKEHIKKIKRYIKNYYQKYIKGNVKNFLQKHWKIILILTIAIIIIVYLINTFSGMVSTLSEDV